MLRRSRVSGAPDAGRLAELLSRPGIDPRLNLVLGVVEAFHVDQDHGVFADVFLMSGAGGDDNGDPVGHVLPCRVGSFYGGPGFGFYAPLQVDDEVLVGIPAGDPDHGGVILAKLWSASELQPDEANNNQADIVLRVEKDKNLRILVAGQGKVIIACEDNGKVLLGDESNTKSVNREGDKTNQGQWAVVKQNVGLGAVPVVTDVVFQGPGAVTSQALPMAAAPPPTPLVGGKLEGVTEHGSDKVEASD